MDAFVIKGGRPLRGTVRINGSKNASLPLMAVGLMTDQPVVLRDVPDLADIRNMVKLLQSLGCEVETGQAAPQMVKRSPEPVAAATAPTTRSSAEDYGGPYRGLNELVKGRKRDAPLGSRDPEPEAKPQEKPATPAPQPTSGGGGGATAPGQPVMTLHSTDPSKSVAHYDIVRTMRAGICVLGPLLGARGEAKVSMPGGCAIGDRPVDLHVRGLRALGARITLESGYIHATAPGGPGTKLRGAHVFLGGPMGSTVLGTANVMSAAALAEGVTVIESAACEPEVEDLANLLNSMGAKIRGAGSPTIIIEGVDKLNGCEHTVIPDRIEAGTYVAAAAITNGDITLTNFPTAMLTAFLDRLAEVGVGIEPVNGKLDSPSPRPRSGMFPGNRESVRVNSVRRLMPVQIVTQPHPGFPTDLQAQVMALLTLADGNSIITEKIFPDRFMHVPELLRMGANITRTGNSAIVTGARELIGAPVMASDLRASAGLVIAGLAARGETLINRVYHLDRGYQRMELTLQALGADIERVHDKSV